MWYLRFKILSSDTRWWGHLIEKKNMWEAVRATGWLILKSLRGLVSLSLCCQILLRGWFAQRRTVVHRLPSNTGGKENSIGALETTRDCFKRLLPIWAFFFLRERLDPKSLYGTLLNFFYNFLKMINIYIYWISSFPSKFSFIPFYTIV